MDYLYIVKKKSVNDDDLTYVIEKNPDTLPANVVIPELVRYEPNRNYLLFHNLSSSKFVSGKCFVLPSGINNIKADYDKSFVTIDYTFLFTEGSLIRRRAYTCDVHCDGSCLQQVLITVYRMDVFDEYLVVVDEFLQKNDSYVARCKTLEDVEKALKLEYYGITDSQDFRHQEIDVNTLKLDHMFKHTEGELPVTFCTLD